MSADSTSRSSRGLSEQMLVESSNGSMGQPVREIDAGAAQPRLHIDRGCGLDVVAYVGDVDMQRVIAVGEAVHPDGVVEIARGFRRRWSPHPGRGSRAGPCPPI